MHDTSNIIKYTQQALKLSSPNPTTHKAGTYSTD